MGEGPAETVEQTITTEGVVPAAGNVFAAAGSEDRRYALIAELARGGGGGRITVAVDRKLGRRVALKRPLDPAGEAWLEREALVLAQLEHPSIVPIHDAGLDHEGSPFYTMKLIDGETLAERLKRMAAFDQRVALLAAVTMVAAAMAYAMARPIRPAWTSRWATRCHLAREHSPICSMLSRTCWESASSAAETVLRYPNS